MRLDDAMLRSSWLCLFSGHTEVTLECRPSKLLDGSIEITEKHHLPNKQLVCVAARCEFSAWKISDPISCIHAVAAMLLQRNCTEITSILARYPEFRPMISHKAPHTCQDLSNKQSHCRTTSSRCVGTMCRHISLDAGKDCSSWRIFQPDSRRKSIPAVSSCRGAILSCRHDVTSRMRGNPTRRPLAT